MFHFISSSKMRSKLASSFAFSQFATHFGLRDKVKHITRFNIFSYSSADVTIIITLVVLKWQLYSLL